MDDTTFNQVLERRIEQLRETLSMKGSEYAKTKDRLKNFKDTAAMNGCTPKQALWGFVSKHIIALKDFINHEHETGVSYAQYEEKIGDIICYMVLLDALIHEDKNDGGGFLEPIEGPTMKDAHQQMDEFFQWLKENKEQCYGEKTND